MLALTMSFGGATAAFAAKDCDPISPGCKTDTTTEPTGNSAANFEETTTETQRGNTNAKGTEDTEITDTTCTGPSGKELSPDHPQCVR
jgi:hypothetical protein